MELREPEPVGLLDDHHGRVRNVDPHLDHRRRDEDVQLAGLEPLHQVTPLGRTQAPMEAADAQTAELGPAQPVGLLLRRPRDARLRLLDQRADHVRLAPLLEKPPEPPVGLPGPLLGDPARDHRLPARRGLGDLRHGEISVDGEGERARDRRRGHVQDVRGAAHSESAPLLHPEAVLLVDHRDGEVAQLDALLDQRMRPDDDAGVRDLALGRPREQRHGNAELGAERLDREEVLLGERLRRRHERAPEARLHGTKERVQRDHGLPRAHVSLEEPLHRRRARQIGVDLPDGLDLVRRELERE